MPEAGSYLMDKRYPLALRGHKQFTVPQLLSQYACAVFYELTVTEAVEIRYPCVGRNLEER
jgi:hypothetical protein